MMSGRVCPRYSETSCRAPSTGRKRLRSSYDLWLDGRLQDGRDDTWFKGQPLYAATTFCRLLGQALLREDRTGEDGPHGAVHAAGFDVARHGEADIREALDRLAASAAGPLDEPAKAFGSLYSGLARDYSGEDGFDPYRRILRECVLDHWPIAPWDVLLGEVVAERRLHSLVSASKEIGVGAQVIGHFLIEAGALPEQDVRPPSRRVFDARAHSGLLAEIPTLVGPIAMREAIGATRQELVALEEEGILVPRTRVAKVKNPWRIPDGVTFVAGLRAGAVPVAEDDAAWETPLLARQRTEVGLADLIGTIREGRLAVRAAGGSSRVSRAGRSEEGGRRSRARRSRPRKTPLETIHPVRSAPRNSVDRWACATSANSPP